MKINLTSSSNIDRGDETVTASQLNSIPLYFSVTVLQSHFAVHVRCGHTHGITDNKLPHEIGVNNFTFFKFSKNTRAACRRQIAAASCRHTLVFGGKLPFFRYSEISY
jgi:hypothetical protein